MNKKLTLTFAMTALLAAGNANADTKLVALDAVNNTTIASFDLGNISKLHFADGNLVVTLSDETIQSVALSTSLQLKFDETTTAISQLKTTSGTFGIVYDGQLLSASGLDGTCDAAIYNISGQRVSNLKAWNGSPVSTASLSSGMYIIKANNKSLKFVKK